MSFIRNSRVLQIVLALAVAAMMSACGVDRSPVASSDDADRTIPDSALAPAAKKATSSETDNTEATSDENVTSKKGPARYSMGG